MGRSGTKNIKKNRIYHITYAIIMFDVNDLKLVNDNQGHQKGDQLLVCSAEIIRTAVESVKGICYRIGGADCNSME